jgi:NAD(P)H-dependent FMN reductase
MATLKIKIILASIRPNRFGDKPAEWLLDLAKEQPSAEFELLDLKDYQLPIFAEAQSPSAAKGVYDSPEVNRWAAKIAAADGFIIVTPEYNHGYPASLKNNLDYLYQEWNKKPVAFVSYGSAGGARAVEQLRQVAVELQMAPLRSAVHIFTPWNLVAADGSLNPGALDSYVPSAQHLLEQLMWWAEALAQARAGK